MNILPHIPHYLNEANYHRALYALYSELHGIPPDVVVHTSHRDTLSAVASQLKCNLSIAATHVTHPLSKYPQRVLHAHFLTRLVLEDLYQNEDIHPDFYPQLPDDATDRDITMFMLEYQTPDA